MPQRGRQRRLLWLLAALVVSAILLSAAVGLAADLLWFGEQGQAGTFWRLFRARLSVRLGLWALYAAVLFVNLRIAAASFGSIRRRISNIEIHEAIKPLHLNVTAGAAALTLGFLFTAGVASQWPRFLLYLNSTPFGIRDPVFGRDVAFYVFRLPLEQYLQTNLVVLAVLNLVIAVVIYLTAGALEFTSRHVVIRDRPRAHLTAILAALFLLLAWGYRLDMLDLVHSRRGVVHGASYTDVHAQVPGYWALIGLALAGAAVTAWQSVRGRLKPVGLAAAALFTGAAAFKVVVPGVVQQFVVEPDEIAKESPYIAHNIRLTRSAFGLEAGERRPFPLAEELSLETLARSRDEIESIRLWDWRPLLQTYGQLQEIRLYYSFADVDLDRYVIDGRKRQVMLSVREMRTEDLAPNAQTWQNVHLVYTHGYGLVVSPVDEVSSEGLPNFFIRDIPPVVDPRVASPQLTVRRPEIYFGEETEAYAVVNTRVREFDYPRGDQNVYASYAGTGGVPLDASWKKFLFAWRFGTLKFLLADAITPESRLMFDRRIDERVRKLAPFLLYDGDPYAVIHDGRIVWVQDAYTATDDYPYSEPIGYRGMPVNYVRNSVKAVIDAYDGKVRFYVFDETDPILASYRRIFPGLFLPADAMPAGLREHVRYPEDLFSLQSRALQTYHMRNVKVFYNKEDYWNIPNEIYQETSQEMEPYYLVLTLPGERDPQFTLVLPFTPSGKDNMIALLAAKSDGEEYGKLVLYEFPKDELVFGPMQVEARIDQDSRISQQITLWSQKGSTVIRGNLLVIPLERAILYIEPLFLRAQKSQLPELKQVIGAFGARIAMTETLDETLTALLTGRGTGREPALAAGEEAALGTLAAATPGAAGSPGADPGGAAVAGAGPAGQRRALPEGAERPGSDGSAAGSAAPRPGGVVPAESLAARALEIYRASLEAQRAGDWATYGERQRQLGRVLEEMQER